MQAPRYHETQRFAAHWPYLLVVLAVVLGAGFYTWGIMRQLIAGVPFGSNPAPDGLLLIIALIMYPVATYFVAQFLYGYVALEVRGDAIAWRFAPIHRTWRSVAFDDLVAWHVLRFNPLRYGGWGLRRDFISDGWCYTVWGRQGLLLRTKDGRERLIGTRRTRELAAAMTAAAGPEPA